MRGGRGPVWVALAASACASTEAPSVGVARVVFPDEISFYGFQPGVEQNAVIPAYNAGWNPAWVNVKVTPPLQLVSPLFMLEAGESSDVIVSVRVDNATPHTALLTWTTLEQQGQTQVSLFPGGDLDGDGFQGEDDCDETRRLVFPGAPEWCNGLDDDCDGELDNSALDARYWPADGDGDGYTGDLGVWACQPVGPSLPPGDCDDQDPSRSPSAAEIWYDGLDQACDGGDDWDQDADGFSAEHDCNDLDGSVFPRAPEVWYDGVDQDCDGAPDWDQDRDGFTLDQDCDDLDAGASPDREERPANGRDDNCDGRIDE